MANSRKPGPLNPPMDGCRIPALTNGPLGLLDQGDPNVTTLLGDTPGPLGFNDANDPSMGPFGSVLSYVTFLSDEPLGSAQGHDLAKDVGTTTVSAKLSPSAWERTEPSKVPIWSPATWNRVMGEWRANSDQLVENKSIPSILDRIGEKGKAILYSTGEAVDDAGRALRRAVTIDSPEESRALADEIARRRTQNQIVADLRAHGWGDNGLVCMRLGPSAIAIEPKAVNPAYYDSFDQRIARSTNDALQLYAGGALIDAVAIPVLTAAGKVALRFLSSESKLSYGLRQRPSSSGPLGAGQDSASRSSGTIVKGASKEPAPANRTSNASEVRDFEATAPELAAEGKAKDVAPESVASAVGAEIAGPYPLLTATPEIVGPYIELGSKEAIAASRAYKQALNSSEELVVGRLDDTFAGSQLGMKPLNEPDWTINVNDSWVQGGIDGNKPFYLGSNISIANLRSGSPIFPKTVFFRELEQLRDAGYFRQGNYMLPPPSTNKVIK